MNRELMLRAMCDAQRLSNERSSGRTSKLAVSGELEVA